MFGFATVSITATLRRGPGGSCGGGGGGGGSGSIDVCEHMQNIEI